VLAAGALGCAEARAPLPTLVLVTLDTTRADHLSTYGYGRATDPNLAALATRARVFEAAVPSATWTLPSHVSMFSGLDPEEHGCWLKAEEAGEGGMPAVSDETPLFTGPLRAAGYHLLAAVGGPFTSRRYGLLRDFDDAIEPVDTWELSAERLNEWIFSALERRPKDRPLCLFVNYFDAHAPYGAPPDRAYPFPEEPRPLAVVPPLEVRPGEPPPPPELVRDALDQYDRELLVQDEALGALLARLEREGLLADALVIVTADHGEMFGEQPATFGHGCLPFEPVAHVPLVVQRTPAGPVDRVATPVSLANLATTFLAAAGLAPLPTAGGDPRYDLLALPASPPSPYVEHRGTDRWVGALRGPRFKYGCGLGPDRRPLARGVELLIDLQTDPTESLRAPPAPEAAAARARLRAELEQRLAGWASPPRNPGRAVLDAQELELLKAIGYGGD